MEMTTYMHNRILIHVSICTRISSTCSGAFEKQQNFSHLFMSISIVILMDIIVPSYQELKSYLEKSPSAYLHDKVGYKACPSRNLPV